MSTIGWLTPFINVAGQGKDISMRNIDSLDFVDGNGNPDYFIISPGLSLKREYWEKIGECIDKYPDSKFFLFCQSLLDSEREKVREKVLGERENVELLTTSNSKKRLSDLLNEIA